MGKHKLGDEAVTGREEDVASSGPRPKSSKSQSRSVDDDGGRKILGLGWEERALFIVMEGGSLLIAGRWNSAASARGPMSAPQRGIF